jgi:hypothetical protein
MESEFVDLLKLWLKITERQSLRPELEQRFAAEAELYGLQHHLSDPMLEPAGRMARRWAGGAYVLRLADWAEYRDHSALGHKHYEYGRRVEARAKRARDHAEKDAQKQNAPLMVTCWRCGSNVLDRLKCSSCGAYLQPDSVDEWDLS